MKFGKRIESKGAIPTGSMGDIVFLLLVFFMATTIFKMEEGLAVTLPRAEAGVRVPRERVTHVWADGGGNITIDDRFLTLNSIEAVLVDKMRENPSLLVGVNLDASLPYSFIDDLLMQLRRANAINVSFTNMLETN